MTSSSSAKSASAPDSFFQATLAEADPEIAAAIKGELGRQRHEIELIASENIVSRAVLEAQGSVMTNKYAEGYPGARYYGGCEWVDVAETLAIERASVRHDLLLHAPARRRASPRLAAAVQALRLDP